MRASAQAAETLQYLLHHQAIVERELFLPDGLRDLVPLARDRHQVFRPRAEQGGLDGFAPIHDELEGRRMILETLRDLVEDAPGRLAARIVRGGDHEGSGE